MDARELRIGNWVHHGKYWSYRNGNESKEFDFQWSESDWYALSECTLSIENTEPIKLTEEWLFNFGFVYDKVYYQWVNTPIRLGYITTEDYMQYEVSFALGQWKLNNLKYVHQLQNLYYTLTGEELQFKTL